MPSRARTVLFVDDDPSVLRGLIASLRGCPYRALTVTSAAEALRLLHTDRIDVLVADHQMPAMTGMDLLATVSRQFPETARVLLTGQASLSLAIQAVNEGQVCRILTKPWLRDELLAALAAALPRRLSRPPVRSVVSAFNHLSPREAEVFALLARGDRVEQIAISMFLSRHTVRNHLKAIFRKVGVHSQAELVALARRAT